MHRDVEFIDCFTTLSGEEEKIWKMNFFLSSQEKKHDLYSKKYRDKQKEADMPIQKQIIDINKISPDEAVITEEIIPSDSPYELSIFLHYYQIGNFYVLHSSLVQRQSYGRYIFMELN